MRKSYRVKKESEFQRVFETHNSVANHKFVVYQMEKPGQKHFRVGISVGKRLEMLCIVIGLSGVFVKHY